MRRAPSATGFAIVLSAAAVAALTVAVILDAPLAGRGLAWPLLVTAGMTATELLVFHYRIRGDRYTISFFEVALCVGLSQLHGSEVMLAVGIAALGARLVRRQALVKTVFNVSQFVLASGAAAMVRHVISPATPLPLDDLRSWVAVAAATILGFGVVNFVSTTVVIALAEHQRWNVTARGILLTSIAHRLGNGSLGLLLAVLLQVQPAAVGLVAILAALDLVALRMYVDNREAHDRAEALSVSARDLVASLDTAALARSALLAASSLFKTDRAILLLFDGDKPARQFGIAAGELLEPEAVSLTHLQAAWLRSLSLADPVVLVSGRCDLAMSDWLRSVGWSGCILAPLRNHEEHLGHIALALPDGTSRVDASTKAHAALFASFVGSMASTCRAVAHDRETVRRLKELDALKSDFVATVSHELRSPLTAIQGLLSTLLRPDTHLAPEDRDDFLRRAENQSTRLRRLIEELLVSSQIEGGAVHAVALPMVLPEVVAQVVSDLPTSIGTHRIAVTARGPLTSIATDRDKVAVIVKNLIENALKYSPDHEPVSVTIDMSAAGASVTVDDGGNGVPKESRRQVFDRFFQVESQRNHTEGIGLGLYISSELARTIGANLICDESPQGGARFVLTLPAVRAQPALVTVSSV